MFEICLYGIKYLLYTTRLGFIPSRTEATIWTGFHSCEIGFKQMHSLMFNFTKSQNNVSVYISGLFDS